MIENRTESGMFDAKSSMNGKASSNAEQLKKAGKSLMESSLTEELSDRYEAAKQMTTEAYKTSIDQVKSNPVLSLTAAVAVGAIAGFIFGRRK